MLNKNEHQPDSKKQLTRRDFLKAGGTVIASAAFFSVLAACSSTTTATTTSTTTATSTNTATSTTTSTAVTTTTIPVKELVFASSNSPTHPQSIADQAWMDRMEQLTGGRVHFTPYWGGALMASADSYDELVAGVADITEFSGAYVAADFDIEKAMRILFYGVATPDIARQVYNDVRAQFPQIDQEFSKVKVMARHAVSPYQLFTVSRPVRSLADFGGLRLKTTGEFSQIAGEIGAIGQTVPMADTYVALQKNTVDGAFAPAETLKSFNFGEVVKYVIMLNMAVGPTPHRAFNLDSWNSLPADIQQLFDDNVEWYGKEIEKDLFAADQIGIDFAKQNGAEIIDLPASELASFYSAVNEVCIENMAKLDTKGLPATQIYNKIRELINQYNP